MNFLDAAISYHRAGLKVIPFWDQSGRKKFPKGYAQYREKQTEADVKTLFCDPCAGIALLCTDGIEAIDIDMKHDPEKKIDREWFDYVKMYESGEADLTKCVIQKTKSGGWHVIYRTDSPDGNSKLCSREGEKEAMIETRGKGGILFVYPTPGYSIKQGSLTSIKRISDKGREIFMRCANELGYRPEAEPLDHMPAPQSKPKSNGAVSNSELTPWDDFNRQHDVLSMAESYGWTIIGRAGNITRLNKPGASNSRDVHASIVTTKHANRRFYPWTTATAYDPEKCYSPFAMYAIEEHGGDFKAAARDLSAKGYGDQSVPDSTPEKPEEKKIDLPDLIKKVEATRFDYHRPVKQKESILKLYHGSKFYNVGRKGEIGIFDGHEKSGKSFVLSCVAASGLKQDEVLNFELFLKGQKLLWFDTEQSGYFYDWTQRRSHELAGIRDNTPNYFAYHLRPFTPEERIAAIEYYIYHTDNVGAVVIDGYVDLLGDYNNLEKSKEIVNRLMKWTEERNMLMLGVLHKNKGDGKLRGHLGSELKNKCDFIVSVSKAEGGIFTVSNPTNRDREFPTFEFSRSEENGHPVYEKQKNQENEEVPF